MFSFSLVQVNMFEISLNLRIFVNPMLYFLFREKKIFPAMCVPAHFQDIKIYVSAIKTIQNIKIIIVYIFLIYLFSPHLPHTVLWSQFQNRPTLNYTRQYTPSLFFGNVYKIWVSPPSYHCSAIEY